MPPQLVLSVTESTQVAEARRRAAAVAGALGFDATATANLALVVTELATNLVKYAAGGELLVRALDGDRGGGVEILALDRGRGMANVERCLVDGYSTAGSPGTGLGAVRRLSALFDIHSVAGVGTAVLSVVRPSGMPRVTCRYDVGGVSVAHPGEETCGDDWAVIEDGGRIAILVVDGLGHGVAATAAARAALDAFRARPGLAPVAILARLHDSLRPTRGAAVGVAVIDPRREVVMFCGVGNVTGAVFMDAGTRCVVSYPGIVGHEVRKIVEFTYAWGKSPLLLMQTDGIRAPRALLDRYPGLLARHPSLISAVLYRDLRRERDDATVVAVRPARGLAT